MPRNETRTGQDLSHVGMSLCFYCQEPKEILLDRRLKASLPRQATYDHEPCEKCQGYMQQGVILISVRDGESGDNPYRSGGWVVLRQEAAERLFGAASEVLHRRVAFVEDQTWSQLGLPTPEREG